MNFTQRYIAYLKDNPEGYWFKRKIYGWGWVPATREGWLILAVFIALYVWILLHFIVQTDQLPNDTEWFAVEITAWAASLAVICRLTGEPPKWQWGIPRPRK